MFRSARIKRIDPLASHTVKAKQIGDRFRLVSLVALVGIVPIAIGDRAEK